MNVAICTIAKLENNYIREWVEYHLNLGFNKIFLYDNNDPHGEHFEDVINDYITSGQVCLVNFRGRRWAQMPAFDHCYINYGKDYDWMAFIDADEFITLTEDRTIQAFLSRPGFENFNSIYLKWVYFTDNGLIKVENNEYNCLTRFTKADTHTHYWDKLEYGKRIVRTGISHLKINTSHGPTHQPPLRECYANTEPVFENPMKFEGDIYHDNAAGLNDLAYTKHFNTKSLQEFLEFKFTRGYPIPYRHSGMLLDLNDYFKTNEVTKEKLDYIQDWLNNYFGPKNKQLLQQQLDEYRRNLN